MIIRPLKDQVLRKRPLSPSLSIVASHLTARNSDSAGRVGGGGEGFREAGPELTLSRPRERLPLPPRIHKPAQSAGSGSPGERPRAEQRECTTHPCANKGKDGSSSTEATRSDAATMTTVGCDYRDRASRLCGVATNLGVIWCQRDMMSPVGILGEVKHVPAAKVERGSSVCRAPSTRCAACSRSLRLSTCAQTYCLGPWGGPARGPARSDVGGSLGWAPGLQDLPESGLASMLLIGTAISGHRRQGKAWQAAWRGPRICRFCRCTLRVQSANNSARNYWSMKKAR